MQNDNTLPEGFANGEVEKVLAELALLNPKSHVCKDRFKELINEWRNDRIAGKIIRKIDDPSEFEGELVGISLDTRYMDLTRLLALEKIADIQCATIRLRAFEKVTRYTKGKINVQAERLKAEYIPTVLQFKTPSR